MPFGQRETKRPPRSVRRFLSGVSRIIAEECCLVRLESCQSWSDFQFCCMQSHEVLREVFQKCSAKQIAADLGLSLSMIYKWAEPDDDTGSGSANPLDRSE